MNKEIHYIGEHVYVYDNKHQVIVLALIIKVNLENIQEINDITYNVYIKQGGVGIIENVSITDIFSNFDDCLNDITERIVHKIGEKSIELINKSPHSMRNSIFDPLNDLIKDYLIDKKDLVGIQIGSYAGESTEMFAKSGVFKKLYAIDPWVENYDKNDITCDGNINSAEKVFDIRLKDDLIVQKIKAFSSEVVDKFEDQSIDFIYIDGNHQYNAVKKDLNNYIPKVKKGGIIAGHDYTDQIQHVVGVKKAIDEYFETPPLKVYGDNSWVYIKE